MCRGRNQLHTLGITYTIGVWLMCRGRNQLHTLGIIHSRSMVDVSWTHGTSKLHKLGITHYREYG